MACSRAAWVLGGVRLISSASRMLVKTGPSTKRKFAPPVLVLLQHVRAGDVRGHQVGRELDPLELDVEDPGQRADHQRLGQARHAHQQAVAAGEDGGEDLLDHLVLADDDLLQFLLHQPPVLAELLQDVAEAAGFDGGHGGMARWSAESAIRRWQILAVRFAVVPRWVIGSTAHRLMPAATVLRWYHVLRADRQTQPGGRRIADLTAEF